MIKKFSPTFIANGIFQASTFIITIILARNLSIKAFANFSICMTVMLVLKRLSELGLDQTMVRYGSELLKINYNKFEYVFSIYFLLKFLIALVVFILSFFTISIFAKYFFHDLSLILPLKLSLLNLITTSIYTTIIILFRIQEKFLNYAKITISLGILRLILFFIVIVILNRTNINFLVLIWICCPLLVSSIYIVKYRSFLDLFKITKLQDRNVWISKFIKFGIWIYFAKICWSLYDRCDFFLLSYFSNKQNISEYTIALTIASTMLLFSGSIEFISLPFVSKLDKKNVKDIKKAYFLILKPLIIGLLIIVFFVFFGKTIINFLYGYRFLNCYLPMLILLTAYLFYMISELLSYIYLLFELPKFKCLQNFFQLIVIIISSFILIPHLSKIGAALSVFIMYLTGLLFNISLQFRLHKGLQNTLLK